jgi:flagellar protein FliO/FliZ
MLRFLSLWVLAAAPAFCFEQETTASGVPAVSVGIGQWLLSCLAVIGLMFAMVWFLKKARIVPGGRNGVMQVISAMSISNHERIMVVRTAERYFLIGVTSQNISCLAELSAEDIEKYTSPPASSDHGGFASKFADALKGKISQGAKDEHESGFKDEKGGNYEKD